MTNGVAFESVSKSFGDVHAVRDLTLAAEEGEFLVLVGPSGCGKTTALRMVAGLEMPTAGEISIAGRDVTYLEPRERDIAMVFQSYALYPHMTVEDNLAFGLKQRKTPRAEVASRVGEAARMLEIEHLLKRRPRELSGGQRQRVALGRAIVRRPKVFLMDEPLSNLDAQLRLRTRGELSRLHRQLSTTFMYVTHDQVEAMTMGTRIAVMNGGLLQQLDTPAALYARPANTFVAAFIGSPAMNLIAGEVALIGEAFAFVSAVCTLPLPNTPGLAAIVGRRITLGLRPEDFARTPAAASEGGIGGEVELVEPLGSDQFVTIDADGTHLTARVDPTVAITLGSRLTLIPDTSRAHYFDTVTGSRLNAEA